MTDFWSGRRVLVTGHTGFKGAWLTLWLQRLGAQVAGFSLSPDDDQSTFPRLAPWDGMDSRIGDLRDPGSIQRVISEFRPEIVFHLAAQALVRRSYLDPFDTYHTNVIGTAHLLHTLARSDGVRAVVIVTSDKVYANDGGTARVFSEDDPLGGTDPYSASKALVELLVHGWRECLPRDIPLAVSTARAGNVIGGGDRGAERLLPDAWRCLEAGQPLRLRYPGATRPWQFVLEPLHGYLLLAELLATDPAGAPKAVNLAPDHDSLPVSEVVERVFASWGSGTWESVPGASLPEASVLRLDSTLARETLGWASKLPLDMALDWTTRWWRTAASGGDLRALAVDQIAAYERLIVTDGPATW